MKFSFRSAAFLTAIVLYSGFVVRGYYNYRAELLEELALSSASGMEFFRTEEAGLNLLATLEPFQTALRFKIASLPEALLNELGKRSGVADRYWAASKDRDFFLSNTQGRKGPLFSEPSLRPAPVEEFSPAACVQVPGAAAQAPYFYRWDGSGKNIYMYRCVFFERDCVGLIGASVSPEAIAKLIRREHPILATVPFLITARPGGLNSCRQFGASGPELCSVLDSGALLGGYLNHSAGLIFWGIFVFSGILAFAFLIKKQVYDPTLFFMDTLSDISHGVRRNAEDMKIPVILAPLRQMIHQVISRHFQLIEEQERLSRTTAIGHMATQVAHDIRSPLAALDSITGDIEQLPEEKRILIRSAISRIRDIANNLLEKNRKVSPEPGDSRPAAPRPADSQLLSSLIDPVITEKRLQYRSKMGIDIDYRPGPGSYGLFVKVNAGTLKTILSNLINNAVEAIEEKGTVVLSLKSGGGTVSIVIRDNGCGIPPEILGRLGQRGETYGKPGGSGLGLYQAKTAVEAWGGALDIESEPGRGTAVTLTFPKAAAPCWFVSELKLTPGRAVIVLDDDATIHQVWQSRFESLDLKKHEIRVFHFSTPAAFRGWVRQNVQEAGKALYLADFELLGYRETGLSLVEELGLGKLAVLVTSHYEEESIRENCIRLGSRLIPKGLAGMTPISIGEEEAGCGEPAGGRGAILVDDDPLVRMSWSLAAKKYGISLRVFKNSEEFRAVSAELPKDAAIYIDSDLGEGIKGEQIAAELKERGFTDLTLQTGHDARKFSGLNWLKVAGKEPPWSGPAERL
ncbi:MAG: sensor histidine kinase [Elusimicrobiales bacterium]